MRRYAITVSVAGFFVLAGIGCLADVPPFVCATRALVGAVCLYVMVHLAGRAVLNILIDAIVRSRPAGTGRAKGDDL